MFFSYYCISKEYYHFSKFLCGLALKSVKEWFSESQWSWEQVKSLALQKCLWICQCLVWVSETVSLNVFTPVETSKGVKTWDYDNYGLHLF